MANAILQARPALTDATSIGAGVIDVRELSNLSIATICVAPGGLAEANAAILQAYGVGLPPAGRRSWGRSIAFVWAGPDYWLVIADGAGGRDLESECKTVLGSLASVTDASDGRVVIAISGQGARAVLARGVPIDLHLTSFEIDDVAITHAAHIGLAIWRIDDAPTFHVAIPRSYAESFAHWLAGAARSQAASPL